MEVIPVDATAMLLIWASKALMQQWTHVASHLGMCVNHLQILSECTFSRSEMGLRFYISNIPSRSADAAAL